ncbi:MAG: helix-turn-helix transcriptional regulator [Gallionellaceae bacterium]
MNIGSAICLARKNLGLSKKELAKRVGISPSAITRIENGDRSLSLKVAQDIAKVLGFRLSQLVTIAESILKPEDEIKELQRKLLLSVQPILNQGKTKKMPTPTQNAPKRTSSKASEKQPHHAAR